MSKLVIVLADTDEKYLTPLELKFIEGFQDNAKIEVITDEKYLKSYFSTLRKVDILVINEDLYTPELNKHQIGNLFILTEINKTNNTDEIGTNKIYKYTSVKEIYNEVFNKSSSVSANSTSEKGKTKVFMIYSPSGGAGKTTVSIGLCSAIAKCYKRVLYLNTESLQSFNMFLKNKNFCPVGFEKHMISHSKDVIQYLHGSTGSEIFNYLLPFRQSTASLSISMEDYKYLIETIKASGEYDYIVVDTSIDLTNDKTMMMSYCDKVIIITGQDAVSSIKLECLLNNIDCSDNNKFIFICNKYNGKMPNCLLSGNLVNKYIISEYVEQFDFDYSNFRLELLAENKHFQKLAYMLI